MIKIIALMKRKDGMDFAAFRSWLENDHPKLAKAIPNMQENAEAPFDGATEMWFDSEAAAGEAFATAAGKAAGGDAAAHCQNRFRMVCQEHVQW